MPKGTPLTPRQTAAERAEASPLFQAVYAELEASGAFREFEHALRLDVAYSIKIARESHKLAGYRATWAERGGSAA